MQVTSAHPVDYGTVYTLYERKTTQPASDLTTLEYDDRVRLLEEEGLPTSDAQAMVEADEWQRLNQVTREDPSEQAFDETLAFLNTIDPERRKDHANPSRTDLWRDAHLELAEVAPHANLETRDQAAELIAQACTKDMHITHPGGAYTILDNDDYHHAANSWDLKKMDSRVRELVHDHATDKENEIYDTTVPKVAALLHVDNDEAADVVWNAAREANMCHWQYDEGDLLYGKTGSGLLSVSAGEIAAADAVATLRRCHRGNHLDITTAHELDAVTSLLSDKGLRHGLPLPVHLSATACTEIRDRLTPLSPTRQQWIRELLSL